jgi:aryl-alcohol dehydrogenase-like predicted oxidoreductase
VREVLLQQCNEPLGELLKTRNLGTQGLVVSEQGLGCMGMSEFYGPTDEAESVATLNRALELGINFFDTSDAYGPYRNEELLGRTFRGRRDQVIIATKFAIRRDPSDPSVRSIDGRPEYVREACDASLKRLGIDCVDLYYQHRVDANVPIEDTVGAMADLVQAGKVRYLGLSEAGPKTIRRAHAVHPITALQTEYSLWSRDPEDEILATVRELGIGFVAYSPLGRGFLTGQIKSINDLAEDDYRRYSPRFQGENFAKNLGMVTKVTEMAQAKGVTPGQLALAWVLAQGEDIVPIPGTKRRNYLEENVAASGMELTADDLKELDALAPKGAAVGMRYPEAMMKYVDM